MATLPPVKLGAIIFGAYGVAGLLRPALQRRTVSQAPASARPRRQFYLDLGLSLGAGMLGMSFNLAVFGFPFVSGASLVFGCGVVGFFIGLDMALDRERRIILEAAANNEILPPPRRLFPVTRKFSLVAVATALFVTLIIVMVISRDILWLSRIDQTDAALTEAQMSVTYEILFIMAVLLAMIINLILSYSKNLALLFNNETTVLEQVSQGDLSRLVPVTTNDEFGVIADHTNAMIRGLRHRIQLLGALKLAEEVQRNLLPQRPPIYPGLDISGISIYCNETGGDYFDYLEQSDGRLAVVVADAADHGIGAALHMTTARAFMISAARHCNKPAQLLGDVNRYLVKDSARTGRFVSVFFLQIDPPHKTLQWVRAGHEPAVLYDPTGDRFEILAGEGTVLGADERATYRESSLPHWVSGSVIVIGTDGIHETRNGDDELFGRRRLQELVRRNHQLPAAEIQAAIIAAVDAFRGNATQEDDVTLVVIRLN
jgi:sigma-B regulation protein RsbU (phosphoserine phosphatase)